MSDPAKRITTYAEFWPYYLREHAKKGTRLWHIAGTALASVLLVAAVVSFSLVLFFAAVIVGYAPAWFAHAFVERNHPATFRYPLWSLVSDFRMTGAWLTGHLDAELERAQAQHDQSAHCPPAV